MMFFFGTIMVLVVVGVILMMNWPLSWHHF